MGSAAPSAVGEGRSHSVKTRTCDHRSTDPIDVLSRRLNDVCVRAVDPWQIAAAIEADGLGDRTVAERYGQPNVFALAEDIYHRVPLRVAHEPQPDTAEEAPAWRDLSRGILFVLPGALYIAAVHGFASLESAYALLVSLIFAWVWGQGSGYFGHILIGRGAAGTTRRTVLGLAVVGSVLAALASWFSVGVFGLSTEVIAVTSVQTTYLLAASALLLFRKEHVLFAILVPGVAISAAVGFDVFGRADDQLAAATVAATVAIVAVAAFVATRTAHNVTPATLTRADLAGAVPHMVLGLLWASLVSFSALVSLDAADGAPSIAVTILPLLLSMGIAEWSLRRYLKLTRVSLEEVATPNSFASAARMTMWSTVGRYTLIVAVLTAGAAGFLAITGELAFVDIFMLVSYGQLGAAFLLGQVLASRSRLNEALVISLIAVAMLVGLIIAIGGELGSASLEVAYFVSTLFLATALLIRASMVAGKATTYR